MIARIKAWLNAHKPSVERFGGCVGIRIPLGFRKQLEVWHAPCNGVIEPHIHEHVDTHIFYLWGKVDVMVDHRHATAIGPVRKRKSTGNWVWAHRMIPAGHIHGAKIRGKRGIFAVLETCHKGYESASKDFVPRAA